MHLDDEERHQSFAPCSLSASCLASHAILPKKLNIRLSATASALLAWPNAALAEIPWAIIANLNRIHDLTQLSSYQPGSSTTRNSVIIR